MTTLLTAPQQVAAGMLTPAESKLHFMVKEIVRLNGVRDRKKASLLRTNIRPIEITLLNGDIRELDGQITALEVDAQVIAALL